MGNLEEIFDVGVSVALILNLPSFGLVPGCQYGLFLDCILALFQPKGVLLLKHILFFFAKGMCGELCLHTAHNITYFLCKNKNVVCAVIDISSTRSVFL